ncbi:hypothetical protein [Kitasatospora sp. NPDC057223]|uniref:hypothetical protein n=1 Tax=Kitasatospora sp. NPDC057223 TaxID=3346055 RepID=UPI0036408CF9
MKGCVELAVQGVTVRDASTSFGTRRVWIDRPWLLAQITDVLRRDGIVVVTGGIGVGKTHLVQWDVRASSSDLGRTSCPWTPGPIGELSSKLAEFVALELPRLPRPIVLLPDVDLSPDDLPDTLAASGIQLVIVSRNPDRWRRLATVVEVGAFTRAESVAFLTRHPTGLTDEDAARVAEQLGDLPLALAHAVLWIRPGVTVESFLDRVRSHAQVIFESERPDGRQSTLASEVRQAMNALPGAHQPFLRDVLGALALLDGGPFPLTGLGSRPCRSSWRSAVTSLPDDRQVPLHRLTMAFRTLGRQKLVRLSADEVHLDWLTAQLVRSLLSPAERERAALLAESMLLGTVPISQGISQWEDWPSWAASSRPLLSVDPRYFTSLQGRFALLAAAHFTLDQGRPDEAHTRLLQLLSAWRRVGNVPWEVRVRTLDLLAQAGFRVGRVELARRHSRTAFRIRSAVQGFRHSDTIVSGVNWAVTAGRSDRLPELRTLAEAVPDRRLALRIDSLVAQFQLRSGHGTRPVADLERIVETQTDIVGLRHPDTLFSRYLLAHAYAENGQAIAASGEFEQVLMGQITTLSIGHPDTEATRAALQRHCRESLPPLIVD